MNSSLAPRKGEEEEDNEGNGGLQKIELRQLRSDLEIDRNKTLPHDLQQSYSNMQGLEHKPVFEASVGVSGHYEKCSVEHSIGFDSNLRTSSSSRCTQSLEFKSTGSTISGSAGIDSTGSTTRRVQREAGDKAVAIEVTSDADRSQCRVELEQTKSARGVQASGKVFAEGERETIKGSKVDVSACRTEATMSTYSGVHDSAAVGGGCGIDMESGKGGFGVSAEAQVNFYSRKTYSKTTEHVKIHEGSDGVFASSKVTTTIKKTRHVEDRFLGIDLASRTKALGSSVKEIETDHGIIFNECKTTTKEKGASGKAVVKRNQEITLSSHAHAGLEAAATEVTTKLVHAIVNNQSVGGAELAKAAAKTAAKSTGHSLVRKATEAASKSPTAATACAAGAVSVAQNAAGLCSDNAATRKQARKNVARDTGTAVAVATVARTATRVCPKLPGAAGAAIEVAFAVPEVASHISKGNYEEAVKTGGKATAKGAVVIAATATLGPVGGVIAGLVNTLW